MYFIVELFRLLKHVPRIRPWDLLWFHPFYQFSEIKNPRISTEFKDLHRFSFSKSGATSTIILYFSYSLKEKNNL